jgi:glycolate oxidase FAD binding subunit
MQGVARGAVGLGETVTAVTLDAVAALRDRIASAAASGTKLRIVGRGTWLDAGRPVVATETLSTRDLSGISGYVPADLTLTALAGTTLAEIRDATRVNGQWLALDPAGSDEGTIGATVATASAGPLRTLFGSPRDLVLGLEFITGDGTVARGGGRVVKNVAGFDITRLMTGSWGTLGVITEVTLRLHARPEADETIAIALDDASHVGRVRQLLRRLPFTPYACEILNPSLARTAVNADATTALFRLGGNAEAVAAQRLGLAELGTLVEADESAWDRLRTAEPAGAIVFRLSRVPAELEQTWVDGMSIVRACPGTLLHASPTRGVVRVIVPVGTDAMAFLRSSFTMRKDGTRIGERLPTQLWPAIGSAPTADQLSAGIKRAFDAHNILNPGILGETA